MKKIRVISMILLAISIFVTADLMLNFLSATVPAMNDGIMCRSIFKPLFKEQWSVSGFYSAFATSLWISVIIFIENIVLSILSVLKK